MGRILKLSLIILLLFAGYLYSQQINIKGTFGGSLIIQINELHQLGNNDVGGDGVITYDDFSQYPGYGLSGRVEISFSTITSTTTKELWIDFYKGRLIFKNLTNNKSYTITIPEEFSFLINLNTLECEKVIGVEGKPSYINVNGTNIQVTCDLYPYLLKLY